jgi:pimeloyl-ACP methyl ester carboxylesterase
MATVTTRDGTEIFYKDWGTGPPVVFSHGWPLTADAWDDQLFLAASNGYRAIAHDRRGGGRSGQPWAGNDLDTYADDLSDLIEALDLHDTVLVGHSTGGGEVTRYIGRHGTSRIAKAVLLSAIPPLMLKTGARQSEAILCPELLLNSWMVWRPARRGPSYQAKSVRMDGGPRLRGSPWTRWPSNQFTPDAVPDWPPPIVAPCSR